LTMQADRTIERRMDELAGRASRTGMTQMAWFLSPAEQEQARISADKAQIGFFAWGGTDDAERRIVSFAEDMEGIEWPVGCLEIVWHSRYGAPGHRDLLGSLLGLGIGREKLGDLYVEEGRAFAFVLMDMASYIAANLVRVGNVPVSVTVLAEPPALAAAEGTPVRATVASLRLDAVLGVVWRLSRTRAAELVSSGRVQVNHRIEIRPDAKVSQGAVLSVRGMGRARMHEIGGHTKKDRISVTLLRY
jgi:Uncharacterized conserved protein, contains S4-like domain